MNGGKAHRRLRSNKLSNKIMQIKLVQSKKKMLMVQLEYNISRLILLKFLVTQTWLV